MDPSARDMAASGIDPDACGSVPPAQSSAIAAASDPAGRDTRPPWIGFLADPLWWAAGVLGLLADVSLRFAAPGALAGSVLNGAPQWLSCIVLQPVLEEIVFRGMLQRELLQTRWGSRRFCHLTGANTACSLAFTAVHFVHHPPLWAAGVLVPSLIFGWLRDRHDGVAAAVGMHILYNLEFFSAASLMIP